jgi:hypothetical protein
MANLTALAKILLGGSLVIDGMGLLRSKAPATGLLGGRRSMGGLGTPEGDALRRAGGTFQRGTLHRVGSINERVAFITDRIRKDSLKPDIREKALAVLSRKCPAPNGGKQWCVEPKNHEAEIVAIFKAVQDANSDLALRYVRDHVEVDQFTAADKLLKVGGGDCDDGTILLGALLRAVGYPVKARVVQDTGSPSWSHIYLLVGTPPTGPTKWVPLDWSMYPYKPAGWEAPGAKQVALTGEPHGIIVKVKDFDV